MPAEDRKISFTDTQGDLVRFTKCTPGGNEYVVRAISRNGVTTVVVLLQSTQVRALRDFFNGVEPQEEPWPGYIVRG